MKTQTALPLVLLALAACSAPPPVDDSETRSAADGPLDQFMVDAADQDGVRSAVTLDDGVPYEVTVEGTVSFWRPNQWRRTCGAPDARAMYPSDRASATGVDAGSVFAAPSNSRYCDQPLPLSVTNWHYRPTPGADWTVPDPTAPRSDHAYTYRIVGDGSPLTVAVLDDAHSDNTGRLRVTIRRSQ